MSVKIEDYKQLEKTVEGLRKIVQGCYGSLKKFESKVANFEEKLTEVEDNVVKFNEVQKTVTEKWHTEGGSFRKSLESIEDRVQMI